MSREQRRARAEEVRKAGMGGKRDWKEGWENISFCGLRLFIWFICIVISCLS